MLGLLPPLLVSHGAQACAVCFSATGEARQAFLTTTFGMSALPFLVVGGILLYLRHRARALRRGEG